MLMPTDKRSSHPSLKNLHFATDGDHYRIPHLVKMQRAREYGCPVPMDTYITQFLHIRLKEHHRSGEGKIAKSQRTRTSVRFHFLEMSGNMIPPQYGCLSKT